jgi:hypothetical protein
MNRFWTTVAVIIVASVTPMTAKSQTPPQPSVAMEEAIPLFTSLNFDVNGCHANITLADKQQKEMAQHTTPTP